MNEIKSKYIQEKYIPMAMRMLTASLSNVEEQAIQDALLYSINHRLTEYNAEILNDYKEFKVDTNTVELTDFLYDKNPILTASGVMYEHHGTSPNLISMILTKFLDSRNGYKKERKKYPKGTHLFAYYDLLQLLAKIDANALYGVQGQCTSLFYNIHTATSTTSTGQSLISASGLFFEMFLNDNVKLSSLDELIGFIYNVLEEKDSRIYKDSDILDGNVDIDTCFSKLIMMSGFNWIPTEREMNIVYNIICNISQEDRNRLYYKNNLYEFIYNEKPKKLLKEILGDIAEPMIFPTSVPKNVEERWDEFTMMVQEYVYYGHQMVDRLDKYANKIRSVAIITDTDSVIVSLDYWYRFILELTKDIELPLRYIETDELSAIEGNPELNIVNKEDDDSQERIDMKRAIKPDMIAPQEGLRYTIVNLLSYMLDKFVNMYMVDYVKSCNALHPKAHCLMLLKNEFLFKRVLVKNMRKNYASIQELQEGTIIPKEESLDVKGLTINKSTLKKQTRERLKYILKNYILDINEDDLSQVEVIKQLKKFEDEIYQSLLSGNKEYYKPVKIKPINAYDDPLKIAGIKGSMIYNIIRNEYDEPIDLEEGNALSIVKVNINKKNIEDLKKDHKEVYDKLTELMKTTKQFKNGIDGIALPEDVSLPEWLLEYINFTEIISDNLKNFPIEDIGISRGKPVNAYTNIISF